MAYNKKVTKKPSLLWIADAVAHTGFSTVTHGIIDHLYTKWDVNVLGLNYFGDPHPYSYPIWPAFRAQGDVYGYSKLGSVLRKVRPDIVCIVNDPWACGDYIKIIKEYNQSLIDSYQRVKAQNPTVPEPSLAKIVVYTPVDAKNIRSDFAKQLNAVDLVIGYTEFGITELTIAGLTAKSAVAPHGIESKVYYPVPQAQARKQLSIPPDWYIVGLLNRNQPRKRLDLAFQYFSEWSVGKPSNVKIYYHGALNDVGWDIIGLARYFGVEERLILTSETISAASGVSRDVLRNVYNSFDVQLSTTMGEGWGLSTMEGMACRIPQIVPDWSALGEWARGGVVYVPCTSIGVHPGGINTVGGIADRAATIVTLDSLYTDSVYRSSVAQSGFDLVTRPEFKWSSVAAKFHSLFMDVLHDR